MKVHFLFFVFFLPHILGFEECPGPIKVRNGAIERDAAATYPNDEVVLADDGKTFIPYKYNSGKNANVLMTCPAYTCGSKTFPHGFYIEIVSQIPVMSCEQHRCLNPKLIKCRKTTEVNACSGDEEYMAGFIQRKNATGEWLEFECCRYEKNLEFAFVKTVTASSTYSHEIVLENGTMIASDFVKDLRKSVDVSGNLIFIASIYRMKCDHKNIPKKVPNITDAKEFLIDADGIGKFENDTKKCATKALFLYEFKPTFACGMEKCLNQKKVECQKNVKAENCAGKNQFVGGFGKFDNGTFDPMIVECCEYKSEFFVTQFNKFEKFTTNNISINDEINEFGLPIYAYFVNNITVVGYVNGSTLYSASVYHGPCNGGSSIGSIMQIHQQRSLESMMTDMMRRASVAAAKSFSDVPPEYQPIVKAQQSNLMDMFAKMASKVAEDRVKNATWPTDEAYIRKLGISEFHPSPISFNNNKVGANNQSVPSLADFI